METLLPPLCHLLRSSVVAKLLHLGGTAHRTWSPDSAGNPTTTAFLHPWTDPSQKNFHSSQKKKGQQSKYGSYANYQNIRTDSNIDHCVYFKPSNQNERLHRKWALREEKKFVETLHIWSMVGEGKMLKEEEEGQRGRERNEVGGRRREVGEGEKQKTGCIRTY